MESHKQNYKPLAVRMFIYIGFTELVTQSNGAIEFSDLSSRKAILFMFVVIHL